MGSTRFRLVFAVYVDRHGQHTQGLLYPVDAGRWTQPIWSFRPAPGQELPPLPSGAVVDVEGRVAKDERPLIRAGGVLIRPRTGLKPGAAERGTRMFAEQGDVVVHPAHRTLAARAARRPVSLDDAGRARRRLRSLYRQALFVLVVAGAFFLQAWAFGNWSDRTDTRVRFIFAGTCATIVGVICLVVAESARRRIARARSAQTRPGRPMTMRLVWVVGHGDGPVAMACLRDPAAGVGAEERAVAVTNLPESLVGIDTVDVVVHGDLDVGAVAIEVAGAVLLPVPPPFQRIRTEPAAPVMPASPRARRRSTWMANDFGDPFLVLREDEAVAAEAAAATLGLEAPPGIGPRFPGDAIACCHRCGCTAFECGDDTFALIDPPAPDAPRGARPVQSFTSFAGLRIAILQHRH